MVLKYVAGSWQSGEAAKLFVDTGLVIPSNTPVSRTGSLVFGRGGPMRIGDIIKAAAPAPSTRPKNPEPPFFTVTQTKRVPEDYPTVAAAVSAASPGWVISVASGVYPEAMTFTKDFGGDGIVIRGRSLGSNNITPQTRFDGLIKVTADGYWFHWINFTKGMTHQADPASEADRGCVVTGRRNKWTKCWMRSGSFFQFKVPSSCSDNYIGWNRFTDNTGFGKCFIRFDTPENQPGADAWHANTAVYRNFFRQEYQAPEDGSSPPRYDNNCYMFYFGNGHPRGGDYRCLASFDFEENMIEITPAGWDKAFYVKDGLRSFSWNHFKGAGVVIIRHGEIRYATPSGENTLGVATIPRCWGNRHEALGSSIPTSWQFCGYNIDFRGNDLRLSKGVELKTGFHEAGGDMALYQCAHDFRAVSNKITAPRPYIIGSKNTAGDVMDATQGGPLKNFHLYNHTGTAIPDFNALYYQKDVTAISSTCAMHSGTDGADVDPRAYETCNWTQNDVGFETTGQEAR